MNQAPTKPRCSWASASIKAVLFDMDGTLIDSEIFTERSVMSHLRELGIDASALDYTRFHGVTWKAIETAVRNHFPQLKDESLAPAFELIFREMIMTENPQEIPGATASVRAAATGLECAVVSSSHRMTVDHVMTQLKLDEFIKIRVCAENVSRSKPDPQCYQLAAQKLGLTPKECLVFEDSIAGLTAANKAGMWTVAINRRKSEAMRLRSDQIADHSVSDFDGLAPNFFEQFSPRSSE